MTKRLPRYIKLEDEGLVIRGGAHVELPDDLVIKANLVMRKQGFTNLKSWITWLIRKTVDEYMKEHLELEEEAERIEQKYRLKLKEYLEG